MSTNYVVELSDDRGYSARITLEDSINPLPGSDTWKAENEADFDCKGGFVTSFTKAEAGLSGPVGVHSLVLEKFSSKVKVNDSGTGSKNYEEGLLQGGSISWVCLSKD